MVSSQSVLDPSQPGRPSCFARSEAFFTINAARLGQVSWRCEQEAAGGSGEAVSLLIGGWSEPLLLTLGVSLRKRLHSLFLPLRKCDPMSKTSEVCAFRVRIPFALVDTESGAEIGRGISYYRRKPQRMQQTSSSSCGGKPHLHCPKHQSRSDVQSFSTGDTGNSERVPQGLAVSPGKVCREYKQNR